MKYTNEGEGGEDYGVRRGTFVRSIYVGYEREIDRVGGGGEEG